MTTYNDVILNVLENAFPDEVDFLGQTVIENAIENVKMENADSASNLDNSEILATIITAIGIIKPIAEVFALLYDRLKRIPTKAEVNKEISEQKIATTKNEADKYVDLLINYYLEKNRNANS